VKRSKSFSSSASVCGIRMFACTSSQPLFFCHWLLWVCLQEVMVFEAQQAAAASDFLQQQGWAGAGADDAVPRGSGKGRYGLPARSRMTSEQVCCTG
jgi:hypothetical protein